MMKSEEKTFSLLSVSPLFSWFLIQESLALTPSGHTYPIPNWMGWFILAIGIGLFAWAKKIEKKAEQARFWPTVKGQIKKSSVGFEWRGQGQLSSYKADVKFRYKVGSRSFTNDRIVAGGQFQSLFKKHSESYANKYPEGAEVDVYYNPKNPEEAFLEPRQEVSWVIQLTGAGQIVFGLVVLFQ